MEIEMKLTDNSVRSFKVAKVFRENIERINSIDYSPDGNYLISASDDDQIIVYDSKMGILSKSINSKKYGVDLIRYAHSNSTVIHSSTKFDNAVRYLSLYDNKYIRYFIGHTQKVISLFASPVEDILVSGSIDNTLRLWDLRSPNCVGIINAMGRPVAAFDPEGLVLAVGINSESLKFFDIRSINKGPFVTVKFPQERECDWTDFKFSQDGKTILIPTNGSLMRLIDAYNGRPIHTFAGHLNKRGIPIEASFSPDSQYIFSGSTNGQIHVWNANTGYKLCVLDSDHPVPVRCIKFSPKYFMLATACINMAFWLPANE